MCERRLYHTTFSHYPIQILPDPFKKGFNASFTLPMICNFMWSESIVSFQFSYRNDGQESIEVMLFSNN